MTILVVHSTSSTSSPVTIPSTTAGNCLVVCVSSYPSGGGAQSVSGVTLGGSAGNFSQLAATGTTFSFAAIWADPDCAGGQTSVAVSGSNLLIWGIQVYEVSGLTVAAVLDQSAAATSTGTSWSSGATAATTQAGEIWIGCAQTGTAITGPGSPWTTTAGSTWSCAGYQIVTSTGAAMFSGTQLGSQPASAAAVTLKGAAVAGAAALGASSSASGAAAVRSPAGLAASSSLTAVAAIMAPATLAASTGTLTPLGVVAGTVTLAGAGTAAAASTGTGIAALAGAGTVTAAGAVTGTAALTGAGAVTAAGTVRGTAALTGTAAILAIANSESATLTAVSALTATALAIGGGELNGTSSLTATGTVSGTAEMDGAGGLGAAQPLVLYSAMLAGAGAVTANVALQPAAALAGHGMLTVSAVLTGAASAAGAGTLTATGTVAGTGAPWLQSPMVSAAQGFIAAQMQPLMDVTTPSTITPASVYAPSWTGAVSGTFTLAGMTVPPVTQPGPIAVTSPLPVPFNYFGTVTGTVTGYSALPAGAYTVQAYRLVDTLYPMPSSCVVSSDGTFTLDLSTTLTWQTGGVWAFAVLNGSGVQQGNLWLWPSYAGLTVQSWAITDTCYLIGTQPANASGTFTFGVSAPGRKMFLLVDAAGDILAASVPTTGNVRSYNVQPGEPGYASDQNFSVQCFANQCYSYDQAICLRAAVALGDYPMAQQLASGLLLMQTPSGSGTNSGGFIFSGQQLSPSYGDQSYRTGAHRPATPGCIPAAPDVRQSIAS